ncbi:uncharacterized protein AB675_6412 [Cyphellophora attinorum]|uniref:Uncharacterized protein n=1 Tax=Cyphellophora attinorum TaxID=1664694 RepID=A0A0N1HYX4_9EURO|nr:uncharacterized protein AB675_6412 [Phialophora attinorum]KPI43803.1 hypothetical protein AB675_6412 [Phialophora attinorum]
MESPITRSPSSHSIYAPGPHRRSHPNIQHLSLAPLTPRYPIDPADYLAYHDPTTSTLHTSTSISHIAALPTPGGILTNSPARSRANSRTRLKRKVKSHVNIATPDTDGAPSGAVGSAGYGHSVLRPLQPGGRVSGSKSHSNLNITTPAFEGDSSWLVQTGLALTESSRENKGQSWLGKRDSSTSLVGMVTAPVSPVEERGRGGPTGSLSVIGSTYGSGTASGLNVSAYVRSGRATPNRSRGNSRAGSRRGSRRMLAMTPASPTLGRDAPAEQPDAIAAMKQELEIIQPDWADADTKAEAAAAVHKQPYGYFNSLLAGSATEETEDRFYDLEEEDLYDLDEEDDEDPYENNGLAEHFDNGSDVLDEEEVRREIRKTGVMGRWFDGVVDAMLMLEGEDGEADFLDGQAGGKVAFDDEAKEAEVQTGGEDVSADGSKDDLEEADIETPPEQPQGVWMMLSGWEEWLRDRWVLDGLARIRQSSRTS